ncbi:MAG: radical SAM protein [Alphaproteobacteria bacterium]|nr:radical SAM protein [Alphaproteobacteria bacterium]
MHKILPPLHEIFQKILQEHPETVSWKGQNINNSGLFCAAAADMADALLQDCEKDGFIPALRQAVYDEKLEPNSFIFIGALYALAAARMMERGDAAFAQRLAEEAIAYSQFDIFAQNIVLKANHALDPATRSFEDTEAWLKTRFCMFPFTMLETTTSGEFYRCCPSYVPMPIGTMDAPDLQSVLNSPAAQAIRESILDGSFKYCSKLQCPVIGSRSLMSREEGLAKLAELGEYPEEVTFSHDASCNLSCPSCRTHRVVIPKDEQDKFDSLSERLLVPLMNHAKRISICGSGDPFASIHFRNLLINYCKNASEKARKLALQTNGVLLDRKAWDAVGLDGHVKEILISIDAATEETYAVVRRDGNFKRLHENLRFLSDMRRAGAFDIFTTRFVVQQINFREMPEFVRQGKALGVDCIQFSQLRNWGTFSPEDYAGQSITAREHPEHQAFLDMLKDPIFDDPIVWLGNIDNFRVRAA